MMAREVILPTGRGRMYECIRPGWTVTCRVFSESGENETCDNSRHLRATTGAKKSCMQDRLAAAGGPRCGPWLLRNS
jgi:hypothetical protein